MAPRMGDDSVGAMFERQIEQKTRRPLGDILQGLAGPSLDPQGLRNPYAALAREIRFRKIAARPRKVTRRTSAFSGVFGTLFSRNSERSAA